MQPRSSLPFLALVGVVTLGAASCGQAFNTSTGTESASSTSSGSGGDSSGTAGGPTTGTGASTGSGGGPCATPDGDGDGVTVCDGDCDDSDADKFPGNPELCGDGKDNDCNGVVDDTCNGLGTYVSNSGDNNNPGTKSEPVADIATGINNAITIGNGQPVFVAEGHYPEDVVLKEGVSLRGGHDAVTWAYDPAINDTGILAQSADGVVAGGTITQATVIEGFRIQGKNGVHNGEYGAAFTVLGGAPTIRNNIINAPPQSSVSSIGIVVIGPTQNPAGARIEGNLITGAAAGKNSVGITLISSILPPPQPGAIAVIARNVIRSGPAKYSHGIEIFAGGAGTRVEGNDVQAGSSNNGDSWGIVVNGSPLMADIVLDGNRVNVDQASVGVCGGLAGNAFGWCGGIDSQGARAAITNNVIFGVKGSKSTAIWLHNPEVAPQAALLNGNYLDGAGGGAAGSISAAVVLTVNLGTNTLVGRIRNNIFAGGLGGSRFGIYEDSLANKTCHPEALENNDFFLDPNTGFDYFYRLWDGVGPQKITTVSGVNTLQASAMNFSANPLLNASFHLGAGSPCIDVGTSVEAPAKDLDGENRPKGAAFDVGPDEL